MGLISGVLLVSGCAGTLLAAAATIMFWVRRTYVVVTVRGASMEPTLRAGERVLVRRCRPSRLRPRDVVVFSKQVDTRSIPPEIFASLPNDFFDTRKQWLIKRVCAVPGDPAPRDLVPALASVDHDLVPDNALVVLGDNASASHDSRQYGYVATDRLLGVVVRGL